MKASEYNILRLLDGADKKFIIPVYQRPYSWKLKNCEQLFKDLEYIYLSNCKSHFFGSLVFVSQHSGACEEFIIIDGQQRLTTISLLLLAIRNYVEKNKKLSFTSLSSKQIVDKITNAYLVDPYKSTDKIKLRLSQKDMKAYDSLINGKTSQDDSTVIINYNYLYSKIEYIMQDTKNGIKKLEGIYNAIHNLTIVNISLQPQNGDDPQLIFESLNSTGLELETTDKVRNYILMNMQYDDQEELYNNFWRPIEETIGHNEMNRFIRYYLASKTRRLYDEKKIYFEFKNYKEKNGNLTIEDLLTDMLNYAMNYNLILNPSSKKGKYSKVLIRLNKLDTKTCIPLIMDLLDVYSKKRLSMDDLVKSLEIIENFIVRREICNLPTNALNKMFVQIGAEIYNDVQKNKISYFDAFCNSILSKDGKSRFPSNLDFKESFETYDLYNAKNSIKKYILERLENFGRKEITYVENLINDKILTIEHIMPQTLNDEWKKSLGPNYEFIHTKYLNTPGNLTLTAYNPEYGNASFTIKKNYKKIGYKSSGLHLNESLKTCRKWGEDQIKNRANALYDEAVQIWWIPEKKLLTIPKVTDCINWDEDIDFVTKQVVQVDFLDNLIDVNSWDDVYEEIHSILFNLYSSVYYNSSLPWFNTSKKNLKNAYQLNSNTNAYIELNQNMQAKIDSIKTIAEAIDLDSNDIQFLVKPEKDAITFDVKKESTYDSLPPGKLFFEFFKSLINKNLVTAKELKQLKTKEYSKRLFGQTNVPILANSRDANRGNSTILRYRKDPVIHNGEKLFVTIQFFKEDKNKIIQWYKNHLK